jgi:hypothetical protein
MIQENFLNPVSKSVKKISPYPSYLMINIKLKLEYCYLFIATVTEKSFLFTFYVPYLCNMCTYWCHMYCAEEQVRAPAQRRARALRTGTRPWPAVFWLALAAACLPGQAWAQVHSRSDVLKLGLFSAVSTLISTGFILRHGFMTEV